MLTLASSAVQARIIYDRLMQLILRNKSLARLFAKLTETRGIKKTDGGELQIRASKGDALQGIPIIPVAVIDELHITKPEVWQSCLNGLGGRSGQIFGITTAGDDTSELLQSLYTLSETGGEDFGYAIWEAPESAVPEDDETLAEYLTLANPAIASGRIDVENVISDVRSMKPEDAIRYRLNRFISGNAAFLLVPEWQACETPLESFPQFTNPVFAIDSIPNGEWATITASQSIDGKIYTEIAATVYQPTLQKLTALCVELGRYNPTRFAVNGFTQRALGEELLNRGWTVSFARSNEEVVASNALYAQVKRKTLRHHGDPLLVIQLQGAGTKTVQDRWKIAKREPSHDIDALYATAFGVYFAEIDEDKGPQLFV